MSLEFATATLAEDGLESDLKVGGFSPTLSVQIGTGEVSIDGTVSSSLIIGRDEYSALVLGANSVTAFGGGLKYTLVKTHDFVLTPAFSVARNSGVSFSPLIAAAGGITTKADIQASKFLQKTTRTDWYPKLLGAYAISPELGVTGEGGRIFATDSMGADRGYYRLGAALSINWLPVTKTLPLGSTVFYRVDLPTAAGADSIPLVGTGIYEMFRDDFNFGVEISTLLGSKQSFSAYMSTTFYY